MSQNTMRRALTDLASFVGKRPANNNISSSLRSTRRDVQRRNNSTKTEPSPTNETTTTASTTAVPPPTSSAAAGAAGAAAPPLTTTASTRSAWGIIKSGPIGRFGEWYTNAQNKRPYATQVASSFVIYLAGDLSAQFLFPSDPKPATNKSVSEGEQGEQNEEQQQALGGYDPLRTLRHLTIGVVSSIPAYKWFMFLHRNFNYSSKLLSIVTKVSVQQAVFAPVFNSYFFIGHSVLAGASLSETWERLKKALPSSLINSLKLWPAVTAFSFTYVPPHFRSVFQGSVAVGWQTYLSWLNQKAAREVAAAEAIAAASPAAGVAGYAQVAQAA